MKVYIVMTSYFIFDPELRQSNKGFPRLLDYGAQRPLLQLQHVNCKGLVSGTFVIKINRMNPRIYIIDGHFTVH